MSEINNANTDFIYARQDELNNQNQKQSGAGGRAVRGNNQSGAPPRNIRQNAAGGEYNQNRGNPNTQNQNYQSGQPGSQRNAPAGGNAGSGAGSRPVPQRTGGYRPVQMSGSRDINQNRQLNAPYRGENYRQMTPEQAAAESRRRAEARMAEQRRRLADDMRRRKAEKQRKRVITGAITVFAALALIIIVTVIAVSMALKSKNNTGVPVDVTTLDPFAPNIETDADGNVILPDLGDIIEETDVTADIPAEIPENPIDEVTEAVTEPPAETTWENYTFNFKADLSIYEEYMNPQGDEYLTLINSTHTLDKNYVPDDLVDIIDTRKDGRATQQIRLYAAKSLEAFLTEARAQGFDDISVTSGYRDYNYQSQLFNARLLQYSYLGDEKAYAAASQIVAVPGTSEHQSGLCCDMHNLPAADVSFADTPAGQWMAANCHKFGFIIRFPADKIEITGITFEPWHFRYVGRYHACKMYERGLCLEEYWASLGRA